MGREAAEGLAIGQDGGGRVALYVSLIQADEGIQHGRILGNVTGTGGNICLVGPLQEGGKNIVAKGQGKDGSAYC